MRIGQHATYDRVGQQRDNDGSGEQPLSETRKTGTETSGRGAGGQIVGLAICPAVALKARLLGIVSAKFITEELTAWGALRMQFTVHGWQRLNAKRAE
jgi:hypothetical protein